jgi:hypothetical protein
MVGRHDSEGYCQGEVPDGCLDRLVASLSVLLHQLAHHGLAAEVEVLVVEWNPCRPDATRPAHSCAPRAEGYISLGDVVRSRVEVPAGAPVTVRVLLVTAEMHGGFYNPPGLNLLEYAAKNVAARRARGRFILFTNPDNCLSNAMAAFLARRRLRPDAFYSTIRIEAQPYFRGSYAPASRLPSAEAMARTMYRRGATAGPPPCGSGQCNYSRAACEAGDAEDAPRLSSIHDPSVLYEFAAGDFLLMAKEALHAVRGYPEIPANGFVDGAILYAAVAHGYGQLLLAAPCVVLHQSHVARSRNVLDRSVLELDGYQMLAQDLLDEGHYANHRAGDDGALPPSARPMHRWNDAQWGLAGTAVTQAVLVGACAAP